MNIKNFRLIALLEGISYLLLMGVCMPLKYIWGIQEPNFYMGMAHGILFVAYCILGLSLAIKLKWSLITSFWVFIASLLPFGTFIADKKILKYYAEA